MLILGFILFYKQTAQCSLLTLLVLGVGVRVRPGPGLETRLERGRDSDAPFRCLGLGFSRGGTLEVARGGGRGWGGPRWSRGPAASTGPFDRWSPCRTLGCPPDGAGRGEAMWTHGSFYKSAEFLMDWWRLFRFGCAVSW